MCKRRSDGTQDRIGIWGVFEKSRRRPSISHDAATDRTRIFAPVARAEESIRFSRK